jgi:hypothetical protein
VNPPSSPHGWRAILLQRKGSKYVSRPSSDHPTQPSHTGPISCYNYWVYDVDRASESAVEVIALRTQGFLLAGVFFLLITLGACGGGTAREGGIKDNGLLQDTPTPVNTAQDWPVFPGDSAPGTASPARTASGIILINGDGRVAEAGLYNYPDTLVPSAYVIAPYGDTDPLAYARYTVPNLDVERPVSVDVKISAAPLVPGDIDDLPLSCWVGVSDYTRFDWQWFGPYTTSGLMSIVLNSNTQDILDRYVSSDQAVSPNTFHVVVVTTAEKQFITEKNPRGLSAARIESVSVNAVNVSDSDYVKTKPHYAAIESIGLSSGEGGSTGDLSQSVEIHWTHLADPYDLSLEAAQYQVYRQGPMDAERIFIGSVNAPGAAYVDPANNALDIPHVVPGTTYKYWLCACNPQGHTAYAPGQVSIPLLGPTDVAATDGTCKGKIVLTWTKVEGASGYKIYRDGQTETDFVATVGDVDTWRDTNIAGFDFHTYWLRSTNEYAPDGGEWSAPDAGAMDAGIPKLEPDTLYVIPAVASTTVGHPVTIRIATGQPSNSIVYLGGVGLTVETAATYVAHTFNIGEIGGTRDATDGYWALLGPPPPADGEYMDTGDNMLPGKPTKIGGGLQRYGINISPINPNGPPALIGNGAVLFNLQLTFKQPGVYHLGFQLDDGAHDQTYYSDADQNRHYWNALDNSHTITVN